MLEYVGVGVGVGVLLVLVLVLLLVLVLVLLLVLVFVFVKGCHSGQQIQLLSYRYQVCSDLRLTVCMC